MNRIEELEILIQQLKEKRDNIHNIAKAKEAEQVALLVVFFSTMLGLGDKLKVRIDKYSLVLGIHWSKDKRTDEITIRNDAYNSKYGLSYFSTTVDSKSLRYLVYLSTLGKVSDAFLDDKEFIPFLDAEFKKNSDIHNESIQISWDVDNLERELKKLKEGIILTEIYDNDGIVSLNEDGTYTHNFGRVKSVKITRNGDNTVGIVVNEGDRYGYKEKKRFDKSKANRLFLEISSANLEYEKEDEKV